MVQGARAAEALRRRVVGRSGRDHQRAAVRGERGGAGQGGAGRAEAQQSTVLEAAILCGVSESGSFWSSSTTSR